MRLLPGLGLLSLLASLPACRSAASGSPAPLTVYAAASLGPPFRAFDSAQRAALSTGSPLQLEFSPSLQAVRKMTDLGLVPDLLATADLTLFDSLVVPRYSSWYVVFGSNALVLAYGEGTALPNGTTPASWQQVLRIPGVRIGRSDPRVDPSGYRTLLALDLAARLAGRPALQQELLAAMPERYVRHAEADLSVLVTSGELDYIWTYRNLARAHGLRWLELPDSINQERPELAAWYATAELTLPGSPRPLTVRGTPILFGVTVPREAAHADAAVSTLAAMLCGTETAAIRGTGFTLLSPPRLVGTGAPPAIAACAAP